MSAEEYDKYEDLGNMLDNRADVISELDDMSCSCHINPPCSKCCNTQLIDLETAIDEQIHKHWG